VKPRVVAAIGVGFVVLVLGIVLLGPALLDVLAGPPRPPPIEPLAIKGVPPAPPPPAAPPPPVAPDAGAPAAVETAPPPVEEKPAPAGFLTLTTTPAGLKVAHRENELGKTPLKRVALPVGKQVLTCTDAKGRKKSLTVTMKEGKEQKLSVSWAKMK
jgi:hypothetical protein